MFDHKIEYYSNGKIKSKAYYNNDNGIASIIYYNNGKVCYEKYFINEKGPAYITYYENGVIVKKQWYLYNTKIDGRTFNSILKNMP